MVADIATVFCCAYILGLLLTGVPGSVAGIPVGTIVSLGLGGAIALGIRSLWRMAPPVWVWLTTGLIGCAASFYFQQQLPQPGARDICHWVHQVDRATHCQPHADAAAFESVAVTGTVRSSPRLTRSDRLQFELTATNLQTTPISPQAPQPVARSATRSVTRSVTQSTSQPPAKPAARSTKQSPRSTPAQNPKSSNHNSAKPAHSVPAKPTRPSNSVTKSNPVTKPPAQPPHQTQATTKQPSPTTQLPIKNVTVERSAQQSVNGIVYVTLPKIAGEQLYPGLRVTVSGSLYQPQPAANPGGFDFAQYLRQQGIFTGLIGQTLVYPADRKPAPPLFWSIRQRITQIQEQGLSNPEAALVSAMVMGKAAVDVPYPIQDQFKQTGLAHALAASGTQVSLLLGVILALTARWSNSLRVGLGLGVLILYIGLTGAEASILRAGIMGGATLIALWVDRQIKPVGLLLLAATLLLLWNPLLIWDLGLQLSFLATLGLLVTLPVLTRRLDWLPTPIATLFAVPIAATVWTLPVLLAGFGILSPYSILVNVIVSPLITIVSIGGMISAVAAVISPILGSITAGLLYFPAHFLLQIAALASQLPGNLFAVGTLQVWQTLLLYGLIVTIWRWPKLHRYGWIGILLGLMIVALPAGYRAATLTQMTVLTGEHPILVIQDRGRTGLIYSGSVKDVEFTVLPFLQKQGINHLNWAIAPRLGEGDRAAWQKISSAQPIDLFYSAPAASTITNSEITASETSPTYSQLLTQIKAQGGVPLPLAIAHPLRLGDITVEYQLTKPDVFSIQVQQQRWLWFDGVPSLPRQLDLKSKLAAVEAIGWSGKALHPDLLAQLQPQLGIMFGESIDPATAQWLRQRQVKVHALKTAGALQWSDRGGSLTARSD